MWRCSEGMGMAMIEFPKAPATLGDRHLSALRALQEIEDEALAQMLDPRRDWRHLEATLRRVARLAELARLRDREADREMRRWVA